MYIEELMPGTEITLEVSSKVTTNKITFKTKAIANFNGSPHTLLVEPIRKDNKILNFKGCVIKASTNIENRDYVFLLTRAAIAKVGKDSYHALICEIDTQPINRRDCYRVMLSEDAVIRIGENTKTIECITRDLSISGISFLIPKEEKTIIGDVISSQFLYKPNNKTYKVKAKIVRVEDFDERMKIVGCEIIESDVLQGLITQIMRREVLLKRKQEKIKNEISNRQK